MLEAEYKRDMHNNYMVLKKRNREEGEYSVTMLLNNRIPGMLPVELRMVDNERQYYYDITSCQPMSLLLERGRLGREQIAGIVGQIIEIMERGREFLLNEDDYVLNPEYMYIQLSEFQVNLCYAAGFHTPVKDQMIGFIEYLMDRTNYQEQEAVFLTYGLYRLSREEDCTFETLKLYLAQGGEEEKQEDPPAFQRLEEERTKPEMQEFNEFMPEKQDCEREISQYSPQTIGLCILTAAVTLLFIVGSMKTGILYDEVKGPNYIKTAALFLIAAAGEAYVLSKLLQQKNKKPKIVKQVEYIEPAKAAFKKTELPRQNGSEGEPLYVPLMEPMEEKEDSWEKTVVLYECKGKNEYVLTALDQGQYRDIALEEFPFFVGKLKTKVDFVIENQMVSRFHAKLEREADEFFITDLNSTNGTYVNHCRLRVNERSPLYPEDVITFANISYRFIQCK